MNTVSKNHEARRTNFFDRKVAEGQLSDVIYQTLEVLSHITILLIRECKRNGLMKMSKGSLLTTTKNRRCGYDFLMVRKKRSDLPICWWIGSTKISSKKSWRSSSRIACVIVHNASWQLWLIIWWQGVMVNSRRRIGRWSRQIMDWWIHWFINKERSMFYRLIQSYQDSNSWRMLRWHVRRNHVRRHEEIVEYVWYQTMDEYYELHNLFDVILMVNSFENFWNKTLKSFGVDPMHYITAPQMVYLFFLKITMEDDDRKKAMQIFVKKWVLYTT